MPFYHCALRWNVSFLLLFFSNFALGLHVITQFACCMTWDCSFQMLACSIARQELWSLREARRNPRKHTPTPRPAIAVVSNESNRLIFGLTVLQLARIPAEANTESFWKSHFYFPRHPSNSSVLLRFLRGSVVLCPDSSLNAKANGVIPRGVGGKG